MAKRLPSYCVFFLASALLVGQPAPSGAVAATGHDPQKSADPMCVAWQARVDHLSDADRILLARYGILERGSWIVSPDLVDDCTQRAGIERFFGASLAGNVGSVEREFVRRNQSVLSRVLKTVWAELGHTPAVPGDGAFENEKWGLLTYADLPTGDLTILLRQSLASEGVSGSLVYFVLASPAYGIQGDVDEIIRREENPATRLDRTSTTEIYCLALLYSMGWKDIPERLARLSESERTSQVEKKVISALVSRIRAKDRIRWEDLEVLEWEDIP